MDQQNLSQGNRGTEGAPPTQRGIGMMQSGICFLEILSGIASFGGLESKRRENSMIETAPSV
jgi:hypothetical protein